MGPTVLNETTIAALCVGIMLVLILLGFPIAVSLFAAGFTGLTILAGFSATTHFLATNPFTHGTSYALTVIPLFLLMGSFAMYSGLSRGLYDMANKLLGRMPGGLAMASVLACAGFAAICGSSIATAAAIGRIAVPEMLRHGYDKKLATGCIASAGTLGILIPPSATFVVFGYITDTSIGKLLIAGILPGLLTAVIDMLGIYFVARIRPGWAPVPSQRFTFKERVLSIKGAWGTGVIMVVIIGGIYTGIMTPTEAGAVAALVAFILFVLSPSRSMKHFFEGLLDSAKTSGMLMFIIIASFLFGTLLARGNVPTKLSLYIASLALPKMAVMLLVILFYIILGCFLDGLAMILITMPIIFPAVVALGFNPIWFGVVIVKMVEIGQITPPFGMTAFTIHAITPEVPLSDTFKGIGIFFCFEIVTTTLLVAFPQISLFLPGLMT